jgi:hypothetical protein
MKKILLVVLVCLTSAAQAEDRGFIRNDSAATIQGSNLEPSSASVNSVGALQVNIDSSFQTGTSLLRSEDASISEGGPLIMAGARRIDTLSGNPGAVGDAGFINQTSTGALWSTLTPSTTGGWSPYKASALTNTAVTVKASAGNLGGYHCFNPAAAATYIQIYDTAGAVTVGTTTAVLSFGLPASGGGNVEFANGVNFASAIKVAATTTGTGGTAPATAAECNFLYK